MKFFLPKMHKNVFGGRACWEYYRLQCSIQHLLDGLLRENREIDEGAGNKRMEGKGN